MKRNVRNGNNTIEEVACEDSNYNDTVYRKENESMNSDYSEESLKMLNNQSVPLV